MSMIPQEDMDRICELCEEFGHHKVLGCVRGWFMAREVLAEDLGERELWIKIGAELDKAVGRMIDIKSGGKGK